MKILIYSANYAPEPTGIGKYSGEMAEWLVARGHEVRVVAAPPYYPNWQVDAAYRWPLYQREDRHGVDVWRAPLWVPKHPGGLKRVVHLLTFALSSAPVMLRQLLWMPDVVLTVAPATACAPVGWLTARLCGALAWLHVQDFEVDVACQMGHLKGRWLQQLALWCERHLMRRFDKVSSISGKMVNKLLDKGVKREAAESFPNWVCTNGIKPLTQASSYRAELGLAAHQRVVLFSGTWGPKQHLLLIPQVASLLAQRDDIVFVICGDGVMRPQVEQACAGLPNVKLLPLQPAERLSDLLGLADVHLLTQSAEAEDLVLPSKLTGMLASGRPVIATCRADTEIASVVLQCGRIAEPDQPEQLAHCVAALMDDESLRIELGKQARHQAESSLSKDAILQSWLARVQLPQTMPVGMPETKVP